MISLHAPFKEMPQISSSTASAADITPFIRALSRLLERTAGMDKGATTIEASMLEGQ
jgi:hypothetical protein